MHDSTKATAPSLRQTGCIPPAPLSTQPHESAQPEKTHPCRPHAPFAGRFLAAASLVLLLLPIIPAAASAAPDARPFGMSRHDYELRTHEERARRDLEARRLRDREFERDLAIIREQGRAAEASAAARNMRRIRESQRMLEGELQRERWLLIDREFEMLRSARGAGAKTPATKPAHPVCGAEASVRLFEETIAGRKLASAGDYRSAKTPKICGIYIRQPVRRGAFLIVDAVAVKVWPRTGRLAYDAMALEFDTARRMFRTVAHRRFDACGAALASTPPANRWLRISKGMLSGDILRCVEDGLLERHSRVWYDGYFRSVLARKKTD
ncbi:MAG: hypothetical protein MJ061_01950 [Mailhella sp.]|nr:hypothetical protein [Mailhella sp.]